MMIDESETRATFEESVHQTVSSQSQNLIGTKPRKGLKNEGRFKEALSNAIPSGWVLGTAYDQGDCFFDALAQRINEINNTDLNTDKYLRSLCHDFYLKNKELVDRWNADDFGGIDKSRDDYYMVQYTVDECEQHFNGHTPIWGRPHVEGRILCHQLKLKALCVIEILENPETKLPVISSQLITKDGGGFLNEEKAKEYIAKPNIPTLLNEQNSLHFIPLVNECKITQQTVSMIKQMEESDQGSSNGFSNNNEMTQFAEHSPFEMLPNEARMHITRYLDTRSLCFFAATSRRSLGNTLEELQKRQRRLLGQIHLCVEGASTFCYTSDSLYACGDNECGQLGLGHTNNCNKLTQVENVSGTILQVVAGFKHTFVLTDQGLYACGNNYFGKLGLGHINECHQLTRVEDVPGAIRQVAVSDGHTVVLTDQGLYACGDNKFGQLGLGHTDECHQLTRVENVPGTILQVVAGSNHTVVLTDQGLYACGSNEYGQLGLGYTNNCNKLTWVEHVPRTILQVVAGMNRTVVLTDQGPYVCAYKVSQLGLVPGTILEMMAGDNHTFVLTDQGLYACEDNNYGQLGLGHNDYCHKLTRVEDVSGIIMQVVAAFTHTVMLTSQGLYTCGNNRHGELGLGHTNNCNKLTQVENVPGTILQVIAGINRTVVLTDQGLYACGNNGHGQLGVGDENNRSTFTPLSELPLELKQWFLIWRHIDRLITISTSDVACEQEEPDVLPLAAKCTRRL